MEATGVGYAADGAFDHGRAQNAFHHIYAVDESSNAPMRALARSLGFETRNDPFETSKVVHLLYL
jgi:hypothetical protein